MNRRRVMFIIGLLAASGPAFGDDRAQDRVEITKAGENALAALYKAQPSARRAVESAAGYAAFTNFGTKILIAGAGTGKGIAVNNRTKALTYMRMAEIQVGLGWGAKKFQLVWVFENEKALNDFINTGFEFGGQATAAAKAGSQGAAYQGAIAVAPGVWLYQLTDTGLALELTVKGSKYFKDTDLS
jgi:lipid-binding SYLF domain-containing protein